MFRIWFSIAVAAVALAAVGAAQADRGVRPAEPAGKYMTGVVKQKLGNEYDLAWQSLYPPHQRIASLDAYVACESLTAPAGPLVAIKVMRTFDERIRIAGTSRKVMTRAVRMRVRGRGAAVPLPDHRSTRRSTQSPWPDSGSGS